MPRAPNSAATSGLRADRRIRFGVLCRICAPNRTSVSVSCCATVPVSRPIVRSVLPFLQAFRSCEHSVPASVRQTPGPQTSLSACRPSIPHVNPLFRARATPPTYGTGGPRAEQQAHVRNRRPTCRTASPRAGQQAHVQNSKPTCGTAGPHAEQQAHVRNSRPTCETASPRAEQQAHVRNSKPTCGTARSRA